MYKTLLNKKREHLPIKSQEKRSNNYNKTRIMKKILTILTLCIASVITNQINATTPTRTFGEGEASGEYVITEADFGSSSLMSLYFDFTLTPEVSTINFYIEGAEWAFWEDANNQQAPDITNFGGNYTLPVVNGRARMIVSGKTDMRISWGLTSFDNLAIGSNFLYDYKLVVNGTIGAKEIKITDPLTADFVFAEDYQLKPLSEVENYIKENSHLPDIPSAKNMEENGIGVAQMNQLLLQKIEELTLHIIKQQKQIDELMKKRTP